MTEALNVIRKGKVDSKVSIGTPVQQVVYSSTDEAIECLKLVERDLKAASRTDALILKTASGPSVEITLKPAPPAAEAAGGRPA